MLSLSTQQNFFQPHPAENEQEEEEARVPLPTRTANQTLQKNRSSRSQLNPKKSPGYDLITDTILKELLIIAIKHLAQLLNAPPRRILTGAMERSTNHFQLEARKTF
jgi:hypothetical protein